MWHEGPDQRLFLASLRQDELRAEAAAARRSSRGPESPLSIDRARGFHLRVGRILIVVGRTLRDEDARHPSAIHS
jgi:hypothetical protein